MGIRRAEEVTWTVVCDKCGLSTTGPKRSETDARAAAVALGLDLSLNDWLCKACQPLPKASWLRPDFAAELEKERAVAVEELVEAAGRQLRPDQMRTHCGVAETIHGTPIGEHETILPSGQQKDYVVLTAEERAKGFVEPVRRTYRHVGPPGPKHPLRDLTDEEQKLYGDSFAKFEEYPAGSRAAGRFWEQAELDLAKRGRCNTTTTMGQALSETYARCPGFYGATMCVACGTHFPVGERGEFFWEGTSQRVGTASKPHGCEDEALKEQP